MASKKKKIEERKGKQRELYFTKCKKIQYVSRLLRDDFHPSYSLYKSKACDWLITGIRKEFTSKNTKEKISCGVGRTEEISHQRHMGWCEIRTCMAGGAKFALAWLVVRNSHLLGLLCEIRTCLAYCAKFALSLMQLSSEGHIFLFQLQIVHGLSVGFLTS